jgi:Protein of unknown function (DUF3467)
MTVPDLPQEPFEDRPNPAPEPGPQQVQVPTVTARVPSFIGSGVMSTGAIIMTGAHVFVLDFLQQFGNPPQLVGRVIMPHVVMGQFIRALEQNLTMYEQSFGAPPKLPRPDQTNRPSIQEIYDNLKLPDDELPGRFADGVMIRHSPADFCFDFVTHFFPHAAVSRRVFMSAPHVPQLLDALRVNFRKLVEGQGRPPEPPTEMA